ncbi:MAG TPA: isoprenylcysteine carboxylmethyltransferase family protein [Dongiaceae bacterium]|nr:isoprenylcysteine carboxylmethyltransferase family protein [Dongiaceae bacterium]
MGGILAVLYGLAAYVAFLATFTYAIAFVGNIVVPKTIDSGTPGPLVESLIVNVVLLGIFAVQHSVMARQGFKRWWTRIVPKSVERSTFVLFATAALALLLWQWRPMPDVVWSVQDPIAVAAMQGLFWLGWAILLLSTFLLNHFELFGLRQVVARLMGWQTPEPQFRTPFLYKRVRHPLYLGFVIAFWAAPTMTVGHLLFSVATTGYILIGIFFEERDLVNLFGDQYRRYRRQVSMLFPLPGRRYDAAESGRGVEQRPVAAKGH